MHSPRMDCFWCEAEKVKESADRECVCMYKEKRNQVGEGWWRGATHERAGRKEGGREGESRRKRRKDYYHGSIKLSFTSLMVTMEIITEPTDRLCSGRTERVRERMRERRRGAATLERREK